MFAAFVLAFQLVPTPPHSLAETPAMQAAASLAASTKAAPQHLLTTAEKSQYRETGSYDEAVAFYRALAKASPFARLVTIGHTGEGRPLYALIVSRDKAFTPQAAARTRKPVVLLQNGIHAGENGGKDAAMMLLRDTLVSRRHAAWLDKVIILSIPVFNADGHEHTSPYNRINENGPARMGFRVTASRLNLNRDYLKADTPEMRAFLSLYSAWRPDLLIDNHVTDGSDNQYDLTVVAHSEQDIDPPVGAWVKQTYLPALFDRMAKLGHIQGFYYEGRAAAGARLPMMAASPRYSTGYAAAHNRAALLVETHSLKSFKTRVWSHYDVMRTSLDLAAESAPQLRQASLDADTAQSALKPGAEVFLAGKPTQTGEPYKLRALASNQQPSPITGSTITRFTSTPLDLDVTLIRTMDPAVTATAPAGYYIPRQWSAIIDLLRAHGVQMQTLEKPLTAQFNTTRFSDVRFAQAPFEGRFQVTSFKSTTTETQQTLPAGSVFVPISQPAFKVAMHILEPQAPDSAVKWGFFQPIFEQKEYFSDYIFEPIAAQMLAANPQLKAEFEARLATDKPFAANPRARLAWLHQRSPYNEPDKDLYPILRQ